jgi:hypothetical protein
MIASQWLGTMEPDRGRTPYRLGMIRTRAVPQADGSMPSWHQMCAHFSGLSLKTSSISSWPDPDAPDWHQKTAAVHRHQVL